MKKIVVIALMLFSMMSISLANEVELKDIGEYVTVNEKNVNVDLTKVDYENNLALEIDAEEIVNLSQKGIKKIEVTMQYLKLKLSLSELLKKGDIKISSEYKDDLYYIDIKSSLYGTIKNFKTNIVVTIPYDIDEESSYITMYGVDKDDQIINLRGRMNEEDKTVSVNLKTTENAIIPVVNKVLYNDLDEYFWAKKHIEESAAKGIISGKKEGIYEPHKNITRAEFITLVLNTFDVELISSLSRFNDVENGEWYYDYIVTADYYDLTSGVDENNFFPNESITREDMVVIIGKAIDKFTDYEIENKEYSFEDSDEISEYAVPFLEKCLAMELISGYQDGTFRPSDYAIRAEAAVIINKLYNKINEF